MGGCRKVCKVVRVCRSRKCRMNERCRSFCARFARKLRDAVCAHRKCKASAKCRRWCARHKLEEEDFEDFEIELDQDFEIELVDFEDSEYEDLDMHMRGLCSS